MSMRSQFLFILLALDLLGCQRAVPVNVQEAEPEPSAFTGSKAGEEREVAGVKLPFRTVVTWTDGQNTLALNDVRPNVPIDAAKFLRPAPFKRR